MEALGKVNVKVKYNQKDISSDLLPYLISLKYTDHSEGKSDELSITLENVDAFWENEWYPVKGDTIEAEIGFEAMMNCGKFEVDEIEISSPADVVTIKAIAAVISKNIRSKKSVAHENTTLKQVAQKIASDHGLTLSGEIADIQFTRISQKREHDLEFLHRLAGQFGYFMSIRGNTVVFTSLFGIISSGSVKVIDRSDCKSYSLKDKSAKVYRQTGISYFNPRKKAVTTITAKGESITTSDGQAHETITGPGFEQGAAGSLQDQGAAFTSSPGMDSLEIRKRVENDQQAEATAKAALLRSVVGQQEGSIVVPGEPILVAGNNFQFTGIGLMSGKYHIMSSEHSISRQDYTTTLEIKRVGFIEVTHAPRKQKSTKPKNYTIKTVK